MKRNLFPILLAVMLVAALVFIAAPDAKAADSNEVNFVNLSEAPTTTLNITNDTVLNLAGFDATVNITEGVTLSVIDTSFMVVDEDDNIIIDFSGDRAGSLTIAEGSLGTVATVSQYGDYRYLKVDNNGTYSFHPFNMAISQRGINVTAKTVSLEARFIANDVVRDLITDFGIYKANGEITGYTSAKKTFGTKNGVIACYDLTGSLNTELLDETRTFRAYVKIEGIDEPILANQEVDVTPANVLAGVGNAYSAGKYTGISLERALDLYYYNPELQPYLSALETTVKTSEYKLVTNVSELAVGDKIVIVAKDYNYAISTTQNGNNRGQASVTKSGNTVSFGSTIQVFTLVAGKSADTFAFYTGSGYLYAASSSSNYLRTETTLSNNSSWKITISNNTATIVAQGTNTRNVMQYNQSSSLFACYSSDSQKALAIYKLNETSTTSHTHFATEENQATCTNAATCKYCGDTFGSALGHKLSGGTCKTPAACINCDYVEANVSAHKYSTNGHTCDYGCGTTTGNCTDTTPADGICDYCNAEVDQGGTTEPEPTTVEFTLGANGSASHSDGSNSSTSSYTETVNGYKLNITGGTNMYTGARDAKGNSCLKLGTSSKAGSFSFTVPNDVTKVVIYVAKYKDKAATVTVNGAKTTLTKNSNDGAYDEITIDTTTSKTVQFSVSSGYRCMVNTIEFVIE